MGTDIHGVYQRKVEDGWEDIGLCELNRDYLLFSVLANVRNGYRFGKHMMATVVQPISSPRGLPSDFSLQEGTDYYLTELDEDGRYSMGDHSYSWLLGSEILDFAHEPATTRGILSREEYEKWDKVSCPESYCEGIWGRDVFVIDKDSEDNADWTHIIVSWQTDVGAEISYYVERIRRMVEAHGEIRFVFGFDS